MNKLTIIIEDEATKFNAAQTLTLEYRDMCALTEAIEALTMALRCMGFNYPNHVLTYEAPEECL